MLSIPKSFNLTRYNQANLFAEEQASVLWTSEEISMEKDLQDLKNNLSESEYWGVVSTLKLFTLYELRVGSDYWSGYISKIFHHPSILRMAATFSYVELNVHSVFYNKINELLGLDTEEFYDEYKSDPILLNRMNWIARRVTKKNTIMDILKSIGTFSMIEGAILYSSFAFLKHFNSNGKNKLSNLNSGINFSAIDEDIHSKAGAWLFRELLQEALDSKIITTDEVIRLHTEFDITARLILEHEQIIISKIFEKGNIEGITANQLTKFVESRLDLCLDGLGCKAIFKPKYNPISKWFYQDVSSSILHDFFISHGSDYSRNWKETEFLWSSIHD